jgi:RND family efflux transporter MFP subunit
MSSVEPEIHQPFAQGDVPRLSARRAYEQAWTQFANVQTPEEFCSNWLVIQSHIVGGVRDGVVVLLKPGTGTFAPVAFLGESPDRSLLAPVAERALREGRGVVLPSNSPGEAAPRYQLAYPVRVDGRVHGAVGLDIDPRPEPRIQAAIRELQWGAGWLELLVRRHVDPQQAERQRLKVALDLVAALLEHARFKESASAFTTQLASQLGCDRVMLGVLEGAQVKVRAVSHSAQFDARANLTRAVERAMEEALDQEASVIYPPLEGQAPIVARAHEDLLRESAAGSAATFPLAQGERLVGAVTLERAAGHRFDPATAEVCAAVAAIAGPIIEMKRSQDAGLPAHVGQATRGLWQRLAGPGHAGLKLATIGTTLVALVLAFASGPFRVAANATLEGAVQRAITAPFPGYVKEASLRAGDIVKEGQSIGSFDDRDLRLERVRLVSQREQYLRQSRDALAKHDRAQGEILASQVAQAEAQLALVEEQLSRTRLVAPFDGVIVSGDLSQNLGSPVEKGQVLFEVAPLEGYRVALQVDERDIAYVMSGQRGQLTVTSMPGERFPFTVTKVTPVNTAKEGRNFFRVEARVEDAAKARLRPGMEGLGKVEIDERKYVWIWTRGLIDWFRLWLWSWTP